MTSSEHPPDHDSTHTQAEGALRRGASGAASHEVNADATRVASPRATGSGVGRAGASQAALEGQSGQSESKSGDIISPLFALWKGMQGRTLGSFRLIKPIAAGGMGAVFFARKEAIGGFSQPVAVKLVHPHFANQKDFVDMFLDEARIASFVQHSNVCRVLDFGVSEGTYYLAMEYVHGETWGELFARASTDAESRQILPEMAAYVIAQACEGLHAAHVAVGEVDQPLHIVHRDVSPQNIFVAYDGTVRVLDFGVARASERLTTTRAGVVKGKLAYMSPEQVSGGTIDRRVDIWALGVILREALENKRLFRRETDTETLRAVVYDALPAWTNDVPEELQRIVDRALEKDPKERFASAREMGLALSRFVLSARAAVGAPELSAFMHRLFAEQLQQKRNLLHAEITPSRAGSGPKVIASQTPAAADLVAQAVSAQSAFVPRVAAVEHGTELTRARPSRSGLPRSLRPLLSLRSARIQRRLGAGLVGLGFIVLGLAVVVFYQRMGGDAGPPTVVLVRPSAQVGAGPTVQVQASVAEALEPPSVEPALELKPGAARPGFAVEPPDARAKLGSEPVAAQAVAEKALPAKPKTIARARLATLRVASPSGWAELFLGNTRLGTTPGLFKLREGTHTLLVRPFGKGPGYTRTVKVVAGDANKLIL